MKYEKYTKAEIDEEIAETFHERKRQKYIKEIQELIKELDVPEKALTGRKVDSYEAGSGVSESELFPEEGKVLNIGDPWQTLDLPNVVSIDYETGEEAVFPETYEKSIRDFDGRKERLVDAIDRDIVERLNEKADLGFEPANDLLISWRDTKKSIEENNLDNMSSFEEIGKQIFEFGHRMSKFREEYEEWEKEQEGVGRYDVYFTDAWYRVQDLARLFADSYTWQYEILPKIEDETIRKKGISDEDEKEVVRRVVAEKRFLKKTQFAEFQKGAWPEVWFPDESFDRITASWSLSAHVYREMKPEHHQFYFDEMDRVLKKDGVAYIWPIGYYYDDFDNLYEGIQDYVREGGDVGLIINQELITYKDNPRLFIDELDYNYDMFPTLAVFKKGVQSEVYQRVKNSLIEQDYNLEEDEEQEYEEEY